MRIDSVFKELPATLRLIRLQALAGFPCGLPENPTIGDLGPGRIENIVLFPVLKS
jgi:hypothetical protein